MGVRRRVRKLGEDNPCAAHIYEGEWTMQADDKGEKVGASKDGENGVSSRVREIMQRQPINPFDKISFSTMDKWPMKKEQNENR